MRNHIYRLYELSDKVTYGDVAGTCRITGREGVGIPFSKWVKATFTDWSYLMPGDIVCNEALLLFDEKNEEITRKTGREKTQRFRTYSHFIIDGKWEVFTKANKREMYAALLDETTELAIMASSGQKHLVFKNQTGNWQLEEMQCLPDRAALANIHETMQELLALGFNQTEVIEGDYPGYKIMRSGVTEWDAQESILKNHRGGKIFDIAAFLLYPNELLDNGERKISPPADLSAVPVHGPSLQGSLFQEHMGPV